MSTKENKELVRQAIKEWNAVNGDVAKMRSLYDKYYAPGFIYHDVSTGDMNREQTIQTVIRCTMQATHKGTFMGIPATGKQIVVKGVEIDKIVGGKVVEAWGFLDTLGMMTQLGVTPGAAPKT